MTTKQTTGRPISEAKIAQIENGTTTINEVIALFGAPQNQSSIGDKTLYIYQYCEIKGKGTTIGYVSSASSTQSCDELTITFNNDAVVEVHSYQKRTAAN